VGGRKVGGVPGGDEALLRPSYKELEGVDRSRLQQGWCSHTPSISSMIESRDRRLCMWLLDFNQCKITMDERGVDQAVDAYITNGPYYPRPPPHLRKPQGALPDADNPVKLLQLYDDSENWATFETGTSPPVQSF
jgi:Zinc finger protein